MTHDPLLHKPHSRKAFWPLIGTLIDTPADAPIRPPYAVFSQVLTLMESASSKLPYTLHSSTVFYMLFSNASGLPVVFIPRVNVNPPFFFCPAHASLTDRCSRCISILRLLTRANISFLSAQHYKSAAIHRAWTRNSARICRRHAQKNVSAAPERQILFQPACVCLNACTGQSVSTTPTAAIANSLKLTHNFHVLVVTWRDTDAPVLNDLFPNFGTPHIVHLHAQSGLASVTTAAPNHQPFDRKETKRRMQMSRGSMSAHRLFSVRDLGLSNPEPHVDRVIRSFLSIGDAVAARWIEMPRAIVLLQVVPGNPASGAIYFYDRQRQDFYLLSFTGADDNLTVEDFAQILPEYNLLHYAERPWLLEAQCHVTGSA